MASGGRGQWGDERAEEARKTEEARKAAADGAPSGSRPGAGGTGPGTAGTGGDSESQSAIAGRVETAVGESDGGKSMGRRISRR